MTESLIEAERLSVKIGGTSILENVSLRVEAREIAVLIGPNGSGKTTLLKVLLGLERAQGVIRSKPGLKIGYVPQDIRA